MYFWRADGAVTAAPQTSNRSDWITENTHAYTESFTTNGNFCNSQWKKGSQILSSTYYGSAVMWWAGGVLYLSYSWFKVDTYSHSECRSCIVTWWRASVKPKEKRKGWWICKIRRRRKYSASIQVTCELTCAFTETSFEALQETVKKQFSSGQTGRWSRWTITLTLYTLRLSWIAAAQQWTNDSIYYL